MGFPGPRDLAAGRVTGHPWGHASGPGAPGAGTLIAVQGRSMSRPSEPTPVERYGLSTSPFDILYPPTEKLHTLVVENFPALGKLTALRFIEWVQNNPGGVISLPTGKTPEHFIRWVDRLLTTWDSPETRTLLEEAGIDPSVVPDMRSLHFVQIDEFYPIDPAQHNSFYYYANKYYINGFGLDPEKALLIDCSKVGLDPGDTLSSVWPDHVVDLSLRVRSGRTELEQKQKAVLERIDQWCLEYEDRIRALGGIGFFLGGIGPDGHIGFNVRGSDHHSTTRLTETNYETQAAAATDLGGIEVSGNRLVITIGLATITYNPECTALIIAAGEAKAEIVRAAIESEKHVLYPATALQVLPNARFYITQGAAKQLVERQFQLLRDSPAVSDRDVERHVVDLAVEKRKRILDLTEEDFRANRFTAEILKKRSEPHHELAARVTNDLVARIERGSRARLSTRFLHTEPHHDDLMLGYLPYIVRHVRDASNAHYFACLTSGFTAVTNQFMIDRLRWASEFLETDEFNALRAEGYFDPTNETARNRDVWQFLDGVAAGNDDVRHEGIARRTIRDLITLYDVSDTASLRERITALTAYFETQYPGKKDPPDVQQLKGMTREYEAECIWGYFGWNCSNVIHLRLGFYTGDIFTEEPTMERDVEPILRMLEDVAPDVVSVAFDPEGSGPDTHYKVLQATNAAIERFVERTGKEDLRIWGYRNVWYRFHPSESNVYVPVSLNMFAVMDNAFMNTFLSQKDASFPSYEHDGPFSELAQKIQVDQYQTLKICLGRKWFHENPSALIRATRGLVFLREMDLDEFYQSSRKLKELLEDV
jgi:glucosamine-6-phosphate deaminase